MMGRRERFWWKVLGLIQSSFFCVCSFQSKATWTEMDMGRGISFSIVMFFIFYFFIGHIVHLGIIVLTTYFLIVDWLVFKSICGSAFVGCRTEGKLKSFFCSVQISNLTPRKPLFVWTAWGRSYYWHHSRSWCCERHIFVSSMC